jgi:mannose-6-phosphate isomerase-like protein (cupin superfamily)
MSEKLQTAHWATKNSDWNLVPPSGELETQMAHSDGTAKSLLVYKKFGMDIIRFDAEKWVATHTHIWDHILMVLKWEGFVEYDWIDYALEPGMSYMVPGSVPHAIKATSELVLIAIANDHRPAGSEERLDVVNK